MASEHQTPQAHQTHLGDQATLLQRLLRLWPYFSQDKISWTAAILASLTTALTEPAIPALLKPLLDQGFTEGALKIWMIPVAIVGLFIIRGAAQFIGQYALARVSVTGMVDLRHQLFDRLLDCELSLFNRQSASQLANTMVYEVQIGTAQLVHALLNLARDGFTVIALLAFLLYINWRLTLIVLVLVPCVAWILKSFSNRLYRVTRQSQTATDELAYVVEENVLSHRMVRLHAAQKDQAQRFDVLSRRLRSLALRATRASAATTPLTQVVAAVALSAVIAIALSQGHGGDGQTVTVGGFVAFIGAMLMLVAPTRRLADVVNPITRGLAALERGLELLDTTPPEADPAAGHTSPAMGRAQGKLKLKDVSVHYENAELAALRHVSLSIPAGQTLALVGPSGAGKTTLINLLPRFVIASHGSIELDGQDISQWPLQDLRRQFALVSQDVTMFNESIAANVALGTIQPDRERVQLCLEQALLSDFVAGLPQGMDSLVGHNAAQLSGGQRQRLAIARALYKDAPILLLDEATSALDTQSENLVQQALATVMQGRTTLVIAHRLSTIEHADRIVVMEDGRIIESGTHAELMAAGGLYTHLHARHQGQVASKA